MIILIPHSNARHHSPVSDWFIGDDFHHNGAFYLPHGVSFLFGFEQKLAEPIVKMRSLSISKRRMSMTFPETWPLANADAKYSKEKFLTGLS